MDRSAEACLPAALAAFDFGGGVLSAERYGEGHINDTFCVTTDSRKRYILQRISAAAFSRPDQLMRNISGVTEYLKDVITSEGGDPERETLSVLSSRTGDLFFSDPEGRAWRVFPFIEGTVCLQTAETPELFYASGLTFGRFQHRLRSYPAHTLFETIAHFHDTENRLALFRSALAADPLGRAGEVTAETDFILARTDDCGVALRALREGKLPLRVTHNDTKLNNILLDAETGVGLCVIDLDTVMPGLSINDFGDSIRFGATRAAEDERDLSKVNFELSLYEVYTRGFLEGTAGSLTGAELEYLPWGARLMTLECGIRFLTDHLEGDHYFAIDRPGKNLDRARTQFKLVSDMERAWADMNAIVRQYA